MVFEEEVRVRTANAHQSVNSVVASFEFLGEFSFFLRSETMSKDVISVVSSK